MRKGHPGLAFVPQLIENEVKMSKPLIPIDWEKRYGASNVRYDYVPIYDEDGNYVETKKEVYVTMEKLMGFRIFKKQIKVKDTNVKIPKKVKLFETSADKKKDEEEKLKGELK